MPSYGAVITISDMELSTEQSDRVRPALDSVFGGDATIALWTSGRYHFWRVIYTMQAATMLDALEILIRKGKEARASAGLRPEQGAGFSCLLRDLSHPVDLALSPETAPPGPR